MRLTKKRQRVKGKLTDLSCEELIERERGREREGEREREAERE